MSPPAPSLALVLMLLGSTTILSLKRTEMSLAATLPVDSAVIEASCNVTRGAETDSSVGISALGVPTLAWLRMERMPPRDKDRDWPALSITLPV